ncbi:hypothetical protein AOLI_G00136020 [Acnodon oligacanthus]
MPKALKQGSLSPPPLVKQELTKLAALASKSDVNPAMVSDSNDMKKEVSKGGASGCAAPSSSCLSPSPSCAGQSVNISAPFVQGFRDSSAVFSAVIRDALASWAPPPDCVVISYADDILLSSTTEDQCRKGSRMLLEHLATCGFKVSPTKLQWCKPSATYLGTLKAALSSAPALGLPNYGLPFHLYVSENYTTAAGVLAQEHGGNYRPVAYLSKSLDLVVQGMPSCLRAVAACKPTHSFFPGDTVLVKTLNPRKVGEAAYGPPTTVVAVTRTAVLTTSSPQWIHTSRLKKSPIPETPKTRD